MAQFLIISPDSLSLQCSPIMHIDCKRLSKRNYVVLLRTLCKYLFYRRINLQKDKITVDFIYALSLESAIECFLYNRDVFSRSDLAFRVYSEIAVKISQPLPFRNLPIMFNLHSYELSFYDGSYYDTNDDDDFDLPY